MFRRQKQNQRGQGLVEFALTIPIFLVMVLGIVELSRFFLVYSAVYTASREATRYGSATDVTNGVPHYMDCNGIRQVAVDTGFLGGITADKVDIYIESKPSEVVSGTEYFYVVARCDGSDEKPLKLNLTDSQLQDGITENLIEDPTLLTDEFYNFNYGDRVFVKVSADYEPLVGEFLFLPSFATDVNASNGRTIMKNIDIAGTPIPTSTPYPDICRNINLHFAENTGFVLTDNDKQYWLEIINENDTPFELADIYDIKWTVDNPASKLVKVIWNGRAIFEGEITSQGEDLLNPSYVDDHTTPYLLDGQTGNIIFEFDKKLVDGNSVRFTFFFQSNDGTRCQKTW